MASVRKDNGRNHGIKQIDAKRRRPAPTFQARAQLSAEKRIEKLLTTRKSNRPGGIIGKIVVCGILYGVTPGVIQNSLVKYTFDMNFHILQSVFLFFLLSIYQIKSVQ